MNKFVRLGCFALAAATVFSFSPSTRASSHREAPLISEDPLADNTDVYAFIPPAGNGRVTLIANFIPFQLPQNGPNFAKFDDTALYEIHIDNNGDAVEDITYQFRFTTTVLNTNTFLYNTGPITSLTDPDWNVRQTYSVTRVEGPRRTGTSIPQLAAGISPPVNVGNRSTPNYAALAQSAVAGLPGGGHVFAGQRDDSFFIDVGGVFDLLAIRLPPGDLRGGIDGLDGLNVHTIAIELPVEQVTRSRTRPNGVTDPNAIIGVWSTVSRRAVTTRVAGRETNSGDFVQVSRLAQPLVNELVIPRSTKDAFNALEPTGDAAALPFVLDPEVARLLKVLYGVDSPPTPRNDLVTIFLTGLPGLNQPAGVRASEMLRLNLAVPPSASPDRLGVIKGDMAGFPNGRRLIDDVVDIALRVTAGATPLTPAFNSGINARLGDGVDFNDKPFSQTFPYLWEPTPGFSQSELGPTISGIRR
ncbi:MAG: DUF4331 domain-containing protein [Acidobacteriota bacterium]|nr:DUF4331 domain-containing protein [Acidobacteriota bacterium]